MSSKQLAYGDYVYVTLEQLSNLTSKRLFLYSEGFLNSRINLVPSDDGITLQNSREFLFQIFPKLKEHLEINENSTLRLSNHITSFQKKWKAFVDDVLPKTAGKPILYDDVIQLYHVESRSFLQSSHITIEATSTNNPALLSLVQESTDDTLFAVETISNYFEPGEKIFYDSQFFLRSTARNQVVVLKEQPQRHQPAELSGSISEPNYSRNYHTIRSSKDQRWPIK